MTSLALDILSVVYAGPNAAKRIASDLSGSHRTTEGWLARRKSLSADVFLRLVQSNASMREELLRRLGEHGYADTAKGSGVAVSIVRRGNGEDRGLDRSAGAAGRVDAVGVKR